MNKKVLKTMIALVVAFLLGFYILKIFFPEQFMMSIQNENFVKIGNFIDGKLWISLICSGITSFVGTYLFSCVVTRRWYLPLRETIVLLVIIIGSTLLCLYDEILGAGIMTMSMFIIPAMLKADLRTTTIVYCTHSLSQLLSLKIRNLPIYLTNVNSIISIFMMGECYLWLLLFYLYFNYKKEV